VSGEGEKRAAKRMRPSEMGEQGSSEGAKVPVEEKAVSARSAATPGATREIAVLSRIQMCSDE
jgi:hypothetical protein